MAETAKHIDEIVDDGVSWYAVRLFTIRQEEVKAFFIENGLECFVPQQYVVVEGSNGRPHEILRPVVRNLIFVKQAAGERQFRKIIQDADYKISVLRKSKDSQEYALIPHEQMYEFRLMCNPEITMRKFLSSEESRNRSLCKVRTLERSERTAGALKQEVLPPEGSPRHRRHAQGVTLVLRPGRGQKITALSAPYCCWIEADSEQHLRPVRFTPVLPRLR